jgi:hypothetical protein
MKSRSTSGWVDEMGEETSSGGTQVTTTNPPAYQLPYLQEGLGGARGLFQQGGPQQYGGNTVVPFSPQSEAAMQGIEQRAAGGSPVMQGAQSHVTDTLGGKFLNQGNPYLDTAIKRAADTSYNTLTSQFARAGRNVNAAAPLQADMLTDITSRMYGDAYDAERNRQTQALAYASPLAEADYRDLAALQGVGQQVEGKAGEIIGDNVSRWNYDQQRPGNTLDDFLRRVSGNIGSQSTTQLPDVYRNRTAGAAGGALAGYQMGEGSPWWTLAGGLLGAYS